jgi:hypothetical protein
VIGVTQQPAMRRLFEDAFVAKLKAEGVEAVPSYQLIPEDGQVDEARRYADIIVKALKKERSWRRIPGDLVPQP